MRNVSTIADAGVMVPGESPLSYSVPVTIRTLLGCQPIVSDFYNPTAQPQTVFYYTTFGNCTDFGHINIFVDFTTPAMTKIQEFNTTTFRSVTVMVGHSRDTSDIIRHTETPVDLMNGMNIVGFARQHIVRLFRYPGLSVFGFFSVRYCNIYYTTCWPSRLLFYQSSYNLVVSEIFHTIPIGARLTVGTASLTIYPRTDFSMVEVVQNYRDKSILKGLSAVGGLWTFIAFIFGALFGSSLVRVLSGMFFIIKSTMFSFFFP